MSAYDLSPLWNMLLVVALVVAVPLFWIWRRHASGQRLRGLTVFILFLTFDLVLFGAFTRLTDSGLGCPDWPGCYGNGSPFGASDLIAQAQGFMPTGPVTQGKAWIEMLHRYLATSVGALIVVLALAQWRTRGRLVAQGLSPWWALATLVWVCLQGTFGALTVTMKLFPAIVTLHLLGAYGLLALLGVQVVRGGVGTARTLPMGSMGPMGPGLRRMLGCSFALLLLQLALGGWVSANYAVLACSDFPMCQNHWWPEMNWLQGFEIWRPLGLTAAGEHISFAALTAIHYAHRLMAYGVLTLLIALAWQLNRSKTRRDQSRVLAALVGLQLATGLSNVVLGWPLLAALLHTGGAGALVLTLTWIIASAPSGINKSGAPA